MIESTKEKLDYLLVFLIILVNEKTVLFGSNDNMAITNLQYFFMFAIILIYGYRAVKQVKRNNGRMTGLLILLASMLLTSVVYLDFRGGFFISVLLLIAGFCFVSRMSALRFMECFSDIIYYITIYSIIVFFAFQIFPSLLSQAPKIVNTAGNSFYNYILCVIPERGAQRLWGPFSEPGVYQMFLIIALVFYSKTAKKLKLSRVIILVLGLILTKSTTGYIALVPALVYIIMNSEQENGKKKKVILFFLLCGGGLVLFQTTDLLSSDGEVFDKIGDSQRKSTVSRLASLWINLEFFLESPLVGKGLTYVEQTSRVLTSQRYGIFYGSETNTIMLILANFGLFYFIPWFYGIVRFFNSISTNSIGTLLLVITFVLTTSGENFNHIILLYLFFFYGISTSGRSNVSFIKVIKK